MKTLLSNKAYEILKWLCVLALPAVAECVKHLFPLWGIPYGDPIAETVHLAAWLIGVLIGVSTIQYNKQKEQADIAQIKDDLGEN